MCQVFEVSPVPHTNQIKRNETDIREKTSSIVISKSFRYQDNFECFQVSLKLKEYSRYLVDASANSRLIYISAGQVNAVTRATGRVYSSKKAAPSL